MSNTFYNELYQNGEGCSVTGYYCGAPFEGTITMVRSTYGGGLNVYIEIPGGIEVHGGHRDSIVLDAAEMLENSNLASNIHVYF
jgi:hypothetical protein